MLELKIIIIVSKIKFLGLWKLLLVKLVFEKFGDGFEVVCLIFNVIENYCIKIYIFLVIISYNSFVL